MNKDILFWIALNSLDGFKTYRKNQLVKIIFEQHNSNWEYMFDLDFRKILRKYDFNENELNCIENKFSNYNEYYLYYNNLFKNNISVLPITSNDYPKILKNKYKLSNTPPVLFVMGDRKILNENNVAVVGSRKASSASITFTKKLVKDLVEQGKNIVSGYAKGVDREALESALENNGKSIIVLPQGILSFINEAKKLNNYIVNRKLIIISYFKPDAKWSVGLAMARNSIIYGLAEEIYVAESNNHGGTWEGVKEGLKRGDKIYVRSPKSHENNANYQLIRMGAEPFNLKDVKPLLVSIGEETVSDGIDQNYLPLEIIYNYLKNGPKTSKQIKEELKLNISTQKITKILKNSNKILVTKTKPLLYSTETVDPQLNLF